MDWRTLLPKRFLPGVVLPIEELTIEGTRFEDTPQFPIYMANLLWERRKEVNIGQFLFEKYCTSSQVGLKRVAPEHSFAEELCTGVENYILIQDAISKHPLASRIMGIYCAYSSANAQTIVSELREDLRRGQAATAARFRFHKYRGAVA